MNARAARRRVMDRLAWNPFRGRGGQKPADRAEAAQAGLTFERGTRARAVRDVLAKRLTGADEPFAVATSLIKDRGVAEVERTLPKREVDAEHLEQLRDAERTLERRGTTSRRYAGTGGER